MMWVKPPSPILGINETWKGHEMNKLLLLLALICTACATVEQAPQRAPIPLVESEPELPAQPVTDVRKFCDSKAMVDYLASRLKHVRENVKGMKADLVVVACEEYSSHTVMIYQLNLVEDETGELASGVWLLIVGRSGVDDFPVLLNAPDGYRKFPISTTKEEQIL